MEGGPGRGRQGGLALAAGRVVLNLPARIFYLFLPAIGRALGVPLETTSLLLTARAVASGLSPLYGMLSDRWGRQALMLAGLACLVGGSLLALLAPGFGVLVAALALHGGRKDGVPGSEPRRHGEHGGPGDGPSRRPGW